MKYKYIQVQTTIDAHASDEVVTKLSRMGEDGYRVIDIIKTINSVAYLMEKAE